jgi:hypothetical protein
MGNLTEKELDRIVNKIINEAPIDYDGPERMDPSIERKILGKETPYSNHPAMPKMSRDFIELVSSKRFKDTVTKLRSALTTSVGSTAPLTTGNPLTNLLMLVQSALSQSMRIERDNKQTLEKLAVALVTKELSIPKGALQFDAKLIGLGQSESTEKMRRQSEEPSREEMTDLFKDAANHENEIEAFLDAMDTFDKEKAKLLEGLKSQEKSVPSIARRVESVLFI